MKPAAACSFLLMAAFALPVHGQPAAVKPAATPGAAASPAPAPWTLTLETGTEVLMTRGEKRDRVAARATINAPLSASLTAFARGDLGGSQDGGALDVTDPETFRSVVGLIGLRYAVSPAVSVGAVGGATFSAEGEIDAPADPRLFTVAGIVRAALDARGSYAYVGAGHHGPVGGAALLASVAWSPDERVSTAVDFALPFQRDVFERKTWTLSIRALVRAKRFEF